MLPRGLYAITPDWDDTDKLLAAVDIALANGAAVLQYRHKRADAALRQLQAQALKDICQRYQVPLIINDHLDLALSVDADGLHLGGGDGELCAARGALGADKILGASCYQDLGRAEQAIAAGANYVAFGAAFPSATKPDAAHAPLALYEEAKLVLNVPVVAIGGITPFNMKPLLDAGVEHIAVIGALFEAIHLERQTRRFVAGFAG